MRYNVKNQRTVQSYSANVTCADSGRYKINTIILICMFHEAPCGKLFNVSDGFMDLRSNSSQGSTCKLLFHVLTIATNARTGRVGCITEKAKTYNQCIVSCPDHCYKRTDRPGRVHNSKTKTYKQCKPEYKVLPISRASKISYHMFDVF